MNKENLAILAAYLEKLPADYKEFHMAYFYEGDNAQNSGYYMLTGKTECGTVACAAGHGPAAGLVLTPRQLNNKPLGITAWTYYIENIFGLRWNSREAKWLFGGEWSNVDGGHRGAAARIRFYLDDDNKFPDDFEDDYDWCNLDQYPEIYEEYLV